MSQSPHRLLLPPRSAVQPPRPGVSHEASSSAEIAAIPHPSAPSPEQWEAVLGSMRLMQHMGRILDLVRIIENLGENKFPHDSRRNSLTPRGQRAQKSLYMTILGSRHISMTRSTPKTCGEPSIFPRQRISLEQPHPL